ncbi:alkaline phosphatase [Shewanella amazonensis]|uniref:Alkaline phosphatase n=1 Tax=Shewanella amazonensis (strain ATCC BAA-1098 / SB2B) TaxID=326297 RepID=A1S325_SHEAM|nr:alkaline phosphatase [Shewanella amazonensis]ABL98781.1 alkaline phosphatase [Shewanella amazonensis SB2B]
MSSKLLALLLLALPLTAAAADPLKTPSKPKNMVIMIGDGMGPAYTSAYRYFKDNPDTEEIEQTVFDRLLAGMASTYPAPVSGYVTDSAAAATALATGHKSYNGAISVDVNKAPLPTLFEKAREAGLATGVAVSSQINHATPAAFLAHNESRKNYDEIASAILGSDAQVLLGGGQKYFDESLLADYRAKGYQHLTDIGALDTISSGKVLGLFAEVQLPWVIDNPESHQLSRLTAKALELLSQNDKGFVLLVEGSLIDWAGHNNDIVTAMAEMDEFARAIEVVEEFVRTRGDTLMVITADHNTGGLSIGADDQYLWDAALLRGVKASPDAMAAAIIAGDVWQEQLETQLGFTLESDEQAAISRARMQGQDVLSSAIKTMLDKRSYTGWTSGGHTALDVQVFAQGPASGLFIGHQDNTEIAQKMMSLLPKPKKAAAVVEPTAPSITLPPEAPVSEAPLVNPVVPETAQPQETTQDDAFNPGSDVSQETEISVTTH